MFREEEQELTNASTNTCSSSSSSANDYPHFDGMRLGDLVQNLFRMLPGYDPERPVSTNIGDIIQKHYRMRQQNPRPENNLFIPFMPEPEPQSESESNQPEP